MYLLKSSWRILIKKKWGGNRRQSFYSEMRGSTISGGRACERPVGLSMYHGPIEFVEYSWVNIWCMLDWILSQNYRNTLPLHAVDQLARSIKIGMFLWLAGMKCKKIRTY